MRQLHSVLDNSKKELTTVSAQKTFLRKWAVEERERLKGRVIEEEWGARQFGILETLFSKISAPFEVACYFPIRSELNLSAFSQSEWLFPRMMPEHSLLWFRRGDPLTLLPNTLGIPERPVDECVSLETIGRHTLVIVPGLLGTLDGSRLGYGGGYYDRFLSSHKNNVTSVFITHSKLLFDQLPTEDFDVKTDVVITENQIHICNASAQLLCRLRT